MGTYSTTKIEFWWSIQWISRICTQRYEDALLVGCPSLSHSPGWEECRPVASGGARGALTPPPQFSAKQLTLSKPGGQIIPTTVLRAPPDFQTLRRPCKQVDWNIIIHLIRISKFYNEIFGYFWGGFLRGNSFNSGSFLWRQLPTVKYHVRKHVKNSQ